MKQIPYSRVYFHLLRLLNTNSPHVRFILIVLFGFSVILLHYSRHHRFDSFGLLGNSNDFTLFIVGDFGVSSPLDERHPDEDKDAQWDVAEKRAINVGMAMEKIAKETFPKLIVATGDLVYPAGLLSDDDYRIDRNIARFPKSLVENVDWYSVLGNHDCESDKLDYYLKYSERNKRWVKTVPYSSFDVPIGIEDLKLRIVLLDSCVLTCSRSALLKEANFRCDGRMSKYTKGEHFFMKKQKQLEWIKSVVIHNDSTIRWTMVVSHWPIFSFRGNGPTKELYYDLLPILKQSKVDVVASGHNHVQEHIREGAIDYLIAGAGGYKLHPKLKDSADGSINNEATSMKIQGDSGGFMRMRLNKNKMLVTFYDENGKEAYRFERWKE